jgi:integrase
LVQERQQTLTPPSKLTLREWGTQWLEFAGADLRPATRRAYRQALDPLLDEVGTVRLDKVTPLLLTRVFSHLQGQGRGPRRLQLSHTYLKACLSRAVELGLLPANPMERVKKPRWEPRPRRYWTVEQVHVFIQAGLTTRSKWGPLCTLLVTTGLRISEALGLTWGDVDLAARHLVVRQPLVWVDGTWHAQAPKTRAGRRVVSLPEVAIAALARHQARQVKDGERTGDDAPLFRTATGRPPRSEQVRDALDGLCAEAGVPRLNVHGLRHVHAMLALEATGDAYVVQRRLGHSHVNVTLGIYGYSTRDDAAVAGALDQLLTAD